MIQALWNEKNLLRATAYTILKKREEAIAIKTLQGCSDYQFFYCISTLKEHESQVHSVYITPDIENIISASEDSVIIWEWHNNQLQQTFCYISQKAEIIREICLNHYDTNILIFCLNRYKHRYGIRRLNWRFGKILLGHLSFHEEDLNNLIISPNEQTMFFARYGSIRVWSYYKPNGLEFVLREHSKDISSLAISADEKTLFSGGKDNNIKVWNWKLESDRLIRTLEGHSSLVSTLCVTSDGKTLFSGSGDGTIKIWNWQKGELIKTLEGHSLGVNSLVISPDGKTLISGSNDTTIKVWNWKSGKLQATLTGHSAEVNSIVLSSDGKYLFSGSSDKTVKVWGLE